MSTKTASIVSEGDGLRFTATAGTGHSIVIDDNAGDSGMRPSELVPMAVAGCTAMDVLTILRKKQQPITRYAVDAVGHQRPGTPTRFTRIDVTHVVDGAVDEEAVRRAITLSATKYCSVGATVASGIVEIRHGYRLRRPDGTQAEGVVVVEGPYEAQDELLALREAEAGAEAAGAAAAAVD